MTLSLERLAALLRPEYDVPRELGGGRCRVFLAEEAALRQPVVVKVLPPGAQPSLGGSAP